MQLSAAKAWLAEPTEANRKAAAAAAAYAADRKKMKSEICDFIRSQFGNPFTK